SDSALSGKLAAECEGVSKSYGDRTSIRDFSTRVLRGDRVGIVGPTGAGKTTMLNLLIGTLEPHVRRVGRGPSIEMVTIDQRRESLDPRDTLQSAVVDGRGDMVSVGGQSRHVVSYMKDFLFSPEQAGTSVTALSGGERGRLLLARALA